MILAVKHTPLKVRQSTHEEIFVLACQKERTVMRMRSDVHVLVKGMIKKNPPGIARVSQQRIS
jgi:hypothetical protein